NRRFLRGRTSLGGLAVLRWSLRISHGAHRVESVALQQFWPKLAKQGRRLELAVDRHDRADDTTLPGDPGSQTRNVGLQFGLDTLVDVRTRERSRLGLDAQPLIVF